MREVDNIVQKIKSIIGYNTLLGFLSTFICGFLVHLMVYVNFFPAYSGLNLFLNKPEWHAIEGRWFTAFLAIATNGVTMPFFLGMISLLFWALSFSVIVKLFGLRSRTAIVSSAAIFISFPTVAAMNCFMYSSHVFAIAIFFACIGTYLLSNGIKQSSKRKMLVGVCCLIFALATYQEALSLTMVLIFIIVAFDIIDGKKIQQVWLEIGKYSILILLSLGGYYFTFKAYLLLANVESYRDFSLSIASIFKGIIKCYGGGYWFLVWGSVFSRPMGRVIVILTFALIIAMTCTIFLSKQGREGGKFTRIFMLAGLCAICPLVANYSTIVSPDEVRTYRRFAAYVIFFILPILICEKYEEDIYTLLTKCRIKGKGVVQYVILIVAFITVFYCATVDNIAYMNAQLQYEKEYSLVVRVVERIESTEGYEVGMPVVIMFNKPYDKLYGGTLESALDEYIPGMEQCGWGFITTPTGFSNFVNLFIQTNMSIQWEPININMIEELNKEMNKWPENNCTLIRDGKLYMWLT